MWAFIFIFVVIAVVYQLIQHQLRYARLPTFDEYQSQHPGLVKPGRVECFKCGGTKLYVRGLDGALDKKKIHSCSTCGIPLYKSNH